MSRIVCSIPTSNLLGDRFLFDLLCELVLGRLLFAAHLEAAPYTRALQLVALAQDVKGKCVEGRLDGSVNHHPSAGSARKRHAAGGDCSRSASSGRERGGSE